MVSAPNVIVRNRIKSVIAWAFCPSPDYDELPLGGYGQHVAPDYGHPNAYGYGSGPSPSRPLARLDPRPSRRIAVTRVHPVIHLARQSRPWASARTAGEALIDQAITRAV